MQGSPPPSSPCRHFHARQGFTHTGAGGTVGTTVNTYNGDDQLKTSTVNGVETQYGYDPNGSQISVTVGTSVTATYTYDVRNKMVGYSGIGGSASYVYDDDGDRVAETTGGVTTYYLTDTQNPAGYAQPLEEHQSTVTGTPSRTYLIGDHVYGQANSTGSVSYLLVDGHGSTQQITNSTGSVTSALAYTAYGTALNFNPAALGGAYFFGGDAVYDPVSGLYLHGDGTRDRLGIRFIQRDTFDGNTQYPISLEKYLYADADPIQKSDPSGHFVFADTLITAGEGLASEADDAIVSTSELGAANTVFSEVEIADAAAGNLATAIGDGASNSIVTAFTSASSSLGSYVAQFAAQVARTTFSVIGSYPLYTNIATLFGAAFFSLPAEDYEGLEAEGQTWVTNKAFLDAAIAAGHSFQIAIGQLTTAGAGLVQEVQYLTSQGYVWNSTYTQLIPGS
jgi:hypothetical protein